ncbi:MAG: O-antigen ligase family protein [Anaerolineales bacterium]|nr:O-antigen ligase family protein [Anaerolineales bacterium]
MASLRPPTFLDLSGREWRITARWQVWVLIVLALGLAVVAALAAAYINPYVGLGLGAAPLILFGGVVVAPRRELYPYVILLLALFVPFSLPTGRDSRLVLSLVFTMLAFVLMVLRAITVERQWPFGKSVVNAPIIAWAVVTIVALLWSMAFRDPAVFVAPSFPFVQSASAVVMIMLPFAFMATAHYLRTERHLKILVGIFIIAGLIGLVPRFDLFKLPVNIGGMFNMWIIALAAGLALFHRGLTILQRGALAALAGAYVVWGVILHVTWMAGWLPGMLALAIMIVNRSKFAAILTVLLVALVLVASLASVDQIIANENAESGSTRLMAWAVNWSITKDHLLFGTGPAGYAAYYMTYIPRNAMATHSNYIDILAETGLIGFAIYLWMFATIALLGFRLCWRLRGRGDFLQALANAAFAGSIACIVIMAFGDWVIPFAYTQTIMGFDYCVYNWIFMGTLVVIDRLVPPGSGPQSAPALSTVPGRA